MYLILFCKLITISRYNMQLTVRNESSRHVNKCIPVGCVPTNAVATTRCQFRGRVSPLDRDPPQGTWYHTGSDIIHPPWTLPSLAVGTNCQVKNACQGFDFDKPDWTLLLPNVMELEAFSLCCFY